jgi:hypothetical protein
MPWARLLSRDASRRPRRDEVERFVAARPLPTDESGRRAWLCDALEMARGEGLDVIAAHVAPARDWLLAFDPASIGGSDSRVLRRRLKRLQAAVAAPQTAPVSPGAPAQAAAAEPAGRGLDRLPALPLARARRVTAGRRALFVSNREDPDLAAFLDQAFQFRSLRFVEAKPRRLQAAAQAVRQGAVDFVLFATGFASHKDEGLLVRACRTAAVPLVRVNKGRPLAVLSAILRDLDERQS